MERLVQQLSSGGRLLWRRRLRGGLGSKMDVLRVEDQPGARRSLVLRRYVPGWRNSTPERASREYRILGLVESAGVPAPRRVLLDAEGRFFGTPAMVLSYVPGRSFFNPADVARWTGGLAQGLASIHAVTPETRDLSWLGGDGHQDAAAEIAQRRLQLSGSDSLTSGVLEALESRLDRVRWLDPCLIHHDYWPGNTVWYRGRLAAVVDWVDAKLGDAREDLAQCRADLVMSHGIEAADAFLESYVQRTKTQPVDMSFFDLLCGLRGLIYYKAWLKGYNDAGLIHLTAESVEERLRDFVRQALSNANRTS
jgi:aminoglycoside phosphotransferase (APT) family kinase protein